MYSDTIFGASLLATISRQNIAIYRLHASAPALEDARIITDPRAHHGITKSHKRKVRPAALLRKRISINSKRPRLPGQG